jgi:CysZ protein
VFWLVNGWLLGQEYFMLVAQRRLGRVAARGLRRQNRLTLWAAGTLMAAPLSLPLINLVIPVLGVATFTHIFHRIARQG